MKTNMNIKTLKNYSLLEIYQLAKYSIGCRLINSTPKVLKKANALISTLQCEGIDIIKHKKNIKFKYHINKTLFAISLQNFSSDSMVFRQIFINQEYRIVAKLFITNNIPLTTIIDAGANIGLTSIFFKAHFPDAKIIALEPFDSTFRKLNDHIHRNDLADVTTVKKGLWGYCTYLHSDTSRLEWGYRLHEPSGNVNASFEVITISDIMNQYKLEFIDFLKIDIEGGEVSVFSNESNMDWLNKVKVIAIEIHDEYKCRTHIENTLIKFGFILSHSGELTIGTNTNLLPQFLT